MGSAAPARKHQSSIWGYSKMPRKQSQGVQKFHAQEKSGYGRKGPRTKTLHRRKIRVQEKLRQVKDRRISLQAQVHHLRSAFLGLQTGDSWPKASLRRCSPRQEMGCRMRFWHHISVAWPWACWKMQAPCLLGDGSSFAFSKGRKQMKPPSQSMNIGVVACVTLFLG